jgi:hypothetical protein
MMQVYRRSRKRKIKISNIYIACFFKHQQHKKQEDIPFHENFIMENVFVSTVK